MSLTIRALTAADKQTWSALWQGYNTFYKRIIPDSTTDSTFARILDPSVRMYGAVAELDAESTSDTAAAKQIVGFAHWYPHLSTSSTQDVVYLHDLFVDPNVRNKGAGRALIEHVYADARKLNAASVYWHTQNFNHRAQLLYVKVADKTDRVQYRKDL